MSQRILKISHWGNTTSIMVIVLSPSLLLLAGGQHHIFFQALGIIGVVHGAFQSALWILDVSIRTKPG